MRPDRNLHCSPFQFCKPIFGDSQFRRRTSPEQIRRRCWKDQKVWIESSHSLVCFGNAQLLKLRIYEQRLMSALVNLVGGEQQLERIVGLLATEVRRALETPCWID